MKTIITLFTCAAALVIPQVHAQAPAIDWKTVSPYIGYGNCAEQTNDGGYIVGGSYANRFLTFKLDANGTQQWGKYLFSGTGLAAVYDIHQTSDHGYIAAGTDFITSGTDSIGNHGTRDFMITKLDNSGNPQWIKCLGGTSNEEARSIQQTTDGGYIVAGYTFSSNNDVTSVHGYCDYWVVKLNASGAITWQKSLGGANYDYANSVVQTADGGYIVTGYAGSKDGDVTGTHWGGSDNDVWVVKLDASGNTSWQKSYGGSKDDQGNSIYQTADGGYIIAGTTTSNDGNISGKHGTTQDNNDYWVIKIDNTGTLIWQKCLGTTGSGIGAGSGNDIAYSVKQTTDGGYIVAGTVSCGSASNDDVAGYHGSTGSDYWIVKLDNAGAISWQKCLGGNGTEDVRTIATTSDGGYIIAGTTIYSPDGDVSTTSYSDNHPWIVKLKGNGSSSTGVEEKTEAFAFSIYPNPAANVITINDLPYHSLLKISDLSGKLLFSQKTEKTIETISLEYLANGIYIIRLECKGNVVNKKLVVSK